MRFTQSPLAGALGAALLFAGGGTGVALVHHHQSHKVSTMEPTSPPIPADWKGGLVTLAPDTPTPSLPPPVPPPAGVDLLWATVPGDDTTIQAIDWSGKVLGRLTLPASRNQLGDVAPSPDGQRILISIDSKDHVFSAQGRDLGQLPGESFYKGFAWADDDTHFCGLRSGPTQYTSAQLVVTSLGARERTVTAMHWPEGNGGARLLACSMKSDLAVLSVGLGDDSAGHIVEYKVVRLSTGATIRDVHPPAPDWTGNEPRPVPGSLDLIIASGDGRLLALEPYSGNMEVHAADIPVVDAVSGRVLRHVTASSVDFTGDDSAVVTDTARIDIATGRSTAVPARCCHGISAARPGSSDVVVAIATGPPPTPGTSSQPADQPPDDYVLWRADGSTLKLACCGITIIG
jgi:hypothetical protein